ncbi:MAG TPA: STAS domain-containing protein [Tepidisphaeraceae bacterium]|jgi:anti-anti-sigma factor|nr:STAS domain-containing protein [Tepidisphaeraceae bacterium]
MSELFQLQTETSVSIIQMKLPESIDSADFDRLNQNLLALVEGKSSKAWVIDFTDVDYIGSAMLGLIVNFRQRVQTAKGKLALCGLSPKLLEIIQTCCLDRLFRIAKNRQEAIKLVK